MPFGLSIGFEVKSKNYNRKIKKGTWLTLKKIMIALSGPLTNAIFVLLFWLFPISMFGIKREMLIYANLLIGIFNLIPIYPLDGGRIAKGILEICCGRKEAYEYSNKISTLTIAILTAISSIAILYWKNIAILIVLGYLWYLVMIENKKQKKREEIYERFEMIEIQEKDKIAMT